MIVNIFVKFVMENSKADYSIEKKLYGFKLIFENSTNKPTMTPVESLQITNFSEANSRSQQIKIV